MSDTQLILLGAIPAAVLALLVDAIIAATAWGIKPLRQHQKNWVMSIAKPASLGLPVLLVALGVIAVAGSGQKQIGPSGSNIRMDPRTSPNS